MYANTSKCQDQKVDVWVMGHLVTQFQGQISRDAANNRVRGHASVCGYAPPLPLHLYVVVFFLMNLHNYLDFMEESLKSD